MWRFEKAGKEVLLLLLALLLASCEFPQVKIVIDRSGTGAATTPAPIGRGSSPPAVPLTTATTTPISPSPTSGTAHAFPEIVVATEANLVASPYHEDAILPAPQIPAQTSVSLLGRDRNGVWLLITHDGILGWLPAFHSGSATGNLDIVEVDILSAEECIPGFVAAVADAAIPLSATGNGEFLVEAMFFSAQMEAGGSPSIQATIEGEAELSAPEVMRTRLSGHGELVQVRWVLGHFQGGSDVHFRLSGVDPESAPFQAALYRRCSQQAGSTQPTGDTEATRVAVGPTNTPIRHVSGVPTPHPSRTPRPGEIVASGPPTGRIVFTCYINGSDEICRIDPDGSDERRLTRNGATDFYASYALERHRVFFSSRRDNQFEIYRMDDDGRNQQRLTNSIGQGLYAPALSPDGRTIAFTNALGNSQQIWVMEADGSRPQALTDGPGDNTDPVWSPDGTQLAFCSNRDGAAHLYFMDNDGNNQRRVTSPMGGEIGCRVDWSPDGRWLAFVVGSRGSRDIYLLSVDGEEVKQLTDRGDNISPSFSPEGNWITFTSYRDGDGEIYIMRADGSDVRQLTSNRRPDWQPRWGR